MTRNYFLKFIAVVSIIFSWIGAPVSFAAIAVDATSTASTVAGTSITNVHTIGAGSNPALVCGYSTQTTGADHITTAPTANGVSMTRAIFSDGTGSQPSYIYYLLGPTAGSTNIVATSTTSETIHGECTSFTGVNQSSVGNVASSSNSGATTVLSYSITGTATSSWVFNHVSIGDNETTITATTTMTKLSEILSNGATATGYTPLATTSTQVISWSWSPSAANNSGTSLELKEAAATPPAVTTQFKMQVIWIMD